MHDLAIQAQARRAVAHRAPAPAFPEGFAEIVLLAAAVEAHVAGGRPVDDDVIARAHAVDLGADFLDHACPFVTEHDGKGATQVAGDHVPVAVADPGGDQAHPHLTRFGWQDFDFFDLEGVSSLVQNGGFHDCAPGG